MQPPSELIAALRRSERALAEQVCQWESLEFGVAYFAPAFAALPEANQLRDAWLADTDAESAYALAEQFYAQRGLTCLAWTPASGQSAEPIARLLAARGWRCVESAAMHLTDWSLLTATAPAGLRILPARAMPRAFRRTFGDDAAHADLAAERLNDSNLDMFVAVLGDKAVGRLGYLQVGDVARLTDLFVAAEFRRAGIGLALVSHALQLASRLRPRALVAAVPADDAAAVAFFERAGFASAGRLTHFRRPR